MESSGLMLIISNEELRQRTGQVKLSEGGISRAIRWAGHVWRMDESRIARSVEEWLPTGRRRAGRPMKK